MSTVTPEFKEILKEIKDILELNLNDIDLQNENDSYITEELDKTRQIYLDTLSEEDFEIITEDSQ